MSEIKGPELLGVQVFKVIRPKDETGVSGTGHVADGVVFPTGECCVRWRNFQSGVTTWPSFGHFKSIHIDPHPSNETIIEWLKVGENKKEK